MANLYENGRVSNGFPFGFRIRLVERDEYLDPQVDHPLYTEAVDECLSFNHTAIGPKHLKVYVEWDCSSEEAEQIPDEILREKYVEDASVEQVKNMPESASTTTLMDCLNLFMQEEKVGMDESWECPHCGDRQTGITKRGTLWTLPDILVVHLKRFRQVWCRLGKRFGKPIFCL